MPFSDILIHCTIMYSFISQNCTIAFKNKAGWSDDMPLSIGTKRTEAVIPYQVCLFMLLQSKKIER